MRLIDADALIAKAYIVQEPNGFIHSVVTERQIIAAPTIDPSSLRPKGEWIYNTDDFTPHKRCTHCGYNKPIAAGLSIKQEPENFCPNCGADMRGDKHD